MKFSRALSIARKESRHVLRDPFTLILALGLPVLITVIFGFAIEFNMKDIPTAVHDGDRTQSSRRLIEAFGSSSYFLFDRVPSAADALRTLTADRNRAALIIEPGFEANLRSGRGAQAQLILDGADNSATGSVLGYLAGLQTIAARNLLDPAPPPPAIELRTRYLFNAELNSRWFIVPGLTVVVVAILSILLTSLTVAREWENGSMELLLSTPVEPSEIIVGKLLPYTALGFGAIGLIYLAARTVFEVPFLGSHLAYLLCSGLFLAACLAQGLLISVLVRRQQLSMQFAMISGLLPSILLSGFIFPVEHMPLFFRVLTAVLPPRWFILASRSIFLEGAGIGGVLVPLLALTLIAGALITVATRKFKRDVEP
ncbi:MAG: ABC transporter permease [Oligoflexia bacterium]|nr:ABC transporter permease [Oligoflexia bacterium]